MGKIITIAQQKGGSGKTTVAAHLAVAWAAQPKTTVAVIDVDPQGSLGEWFEQREELYGDEPGLTFRTASGWGARREARALARDHDVVVLDTPPKSDTEARPSIEVANLVLVPVQPSPIDVWATQSTLDLAAKEDSEALLVVNRVPPRAKLTEEMVEALKEMPKSAAKTRLGNRVAFAEAMGSGRTVLETHKSGKAAEEVAALAQEVHKILSRA
ncbi:MAG: ParA family partition ATPase [Pseudomonadota bacterium]